MKAAMTSLTLRNPVIRRSCGVVCLALFLFLQLFAASGPLHRAIHSDAAIPGHQCIITLLAHGQVSPPSLLPTLIVFVAALVLLPALLREDFFSSFSYRLSSSRGPPRV